MHGLIFRMSIHYWQDQPGIVGTNRKISKESLSARTSERGPLREKGAPPEYRTEGREAQARPEASPKRNWF